MKYVNFNLEDGTPVKAKIHIKMLYGTIGCLGRISIKWRYSNKLLSFTNEIFLDLNSPLAIERLRHKYESMSNEEFIDSVKTRIEEQHRKYI